MFVGRNPDGTIYGLWTVRQFFGQEELQDSDPEVLAFIAPKPPSPRLVTDESERVACKGDATLLALINQTRAEWQTWASTNFPTVTAAERGRIGTICWMLAVAIRRLIRNGS